MAVAWEAAIAAGLEPSYSVAAPQEHDTRGHIDNHGIDTAAVSMVWRMRRRLGQGTPPLLQFVRCAEVKGGGGAILAFSRASASQFGRTLLINARRRAMSEPVPDAFIKRLYHQYLAGPALCTLLSKSIDPEGRMVGPFHAIIVDQESLSVGETACAAAPLCRGTVLVVRAGSTQLRDIQGATHRIKAVGGAVLGTLLIGDYRLQPNDV
jgi:hypothetical protein